MTGILNQMTERRTQLPDREMRDWQDAETDEGERVCHWPGCDGVGDYRAPKSPNNLREYRWFCLDHVRDYNKHWDYFSGLEEPEIEAIRRQDAVWHRPSWPLGGRTESDILKAAQNGFADPMDILGKGQAADPPEPKTPVDEALAKLGLDRNASLVERKARYKELVKRHHPDANGGSKSAEERLKTINEAYTYLLHCDDG
jgi:DnaJ-domain-containing protein 1